MSPDPTYRNWSNATKQQAAAMAVSEQFLQSRVADRLRAAGKDPTALSVRLICDGRVEWVVSWHRTTYVKHWTATPEALRCYLAPPDQVIADMLLGLNER